jgi:hypothetical protein
MVTVVPNYVSTIPVVDVILEKNLPHGSYTGQEESNSRTFKDNQGHVSANSRTKYWREGVTKSVKCDVQKGHNFNEFLTALSDMYMQNQQEEFKDFQVLLHKFKGIIIQGLEFLFSNSSFVRTQACFHKKIWYTRLLASWVNKIKKWPVSYNVWLF